MLSGLADKLKDKATIAVKEHLEGLQHQGQEGSSKPSHSRYDDDRDDRDDRRRDDDRDDRRRRDDRDDRDDRRRHDDRRDDRRRDDDRRDDRRRDDDRDDRRRHDDRDDRGSRRRDDDRDDRRRHDDRDSGRRDDRDDRRRHDDDRGSHHSGGRDDGKYAQPSHTGGGKADVQQIPGSDKSYKTSDCRGNRKALFIGINYTGTEAELRGCINDVKNIRRFVEKNYGFNPDHCVQLTDDQTNEKFLPTRDNIISGFKWLVSGSQPGDSLFLHYSGHGATMKDLSHHEGGDEKDGQDETIVPLDYLTAGQIVDDDIHKYLVAPLKEGVRLTSIFDCCHSGTILDLPFTYTCRGEIEVTTSKNHKEVALAILHAGSSLKRGDVGNTIAQLKEGFRLFTKDPDSSEAQKRAEKERRSDADVIQFSGCRDDQTSADATINDEATGAMSHALVKVLSENSDLSYADLLFALRKELKSKYTQVPQMSTGRPMNMLERFVM